MKFIPVVIIGLLSLHLTGCGVIGGFFPDKTKDYQFSSELPALKIPEDISNKGLDKQTTPKLVTEKTETVAVIGEMVNASSSNTDSATTAATTIAEPVKAEPLHVELVQSTNGETRLQINKSVATAWRMVGKALTRKTIEITARDQANAEFTVQYDANETDFKDDSFWDELTFVFAKDHSQEKPYHIKLLAQDKITEVVVLNEQNQPLSANGGLSLLKFLATTLQADVTDK